MPRQIARSLVALIASLSLTAFAQGEGEGAAETEAPPVETPKTPGVVETPAAMKMPQLKLDPAQDKLELMETARHFFSAVALGEARPLAEMSALPFQLDDKKLNTEEEFVNAWQKSVRQKNTSLLTLYGLEVLTAAEMEKKFGKPPARLANFPWKKQATYIVVANISGHAAVAVFQKTWDGFIAIAYHD